jgi:DNA replication and repair protein RecF
VSVKIKNLYLRNFRNYSEVEVSFSDQINVFVGPNGHGKTNLLEAIYLISTGKSFRTEHLTDLIRENEKAFFLSAAVEKDGIEHQIEITFDGEKKKLLLNGNAYPTLQHLLGLVPSVLHTPWDLELIDGAPNVRRRFLNLLLAQSDPLYVHHFSRFWRSLKQRNALLKQKSIDGIDVWEEEMALSHGYIQKMRKQALENISPCLHEKAKQLSADIYHIAFIPSAFYHYLDVLKKNRSKELQMGTTLVGSHRDDLYLEINEKKAKEFASEGQKRSFATALRLAEWELLTQRSGCHAVLGIDDFGVQLDQKRRSKLLQSLKGYGQIFLTSPELNVEGAKVGIIEKGTIFYK